MDELHCSECDTPKWQLWHDKFRTNGLTSQYYIYKVLRFNKAAVYPYPWGLPTAIPNYFLILLHPPCIGLKFIKLINLSVVTCQQKSEINDWSRTVTAIKVLRVLVGSPVIVIIVFGTLYSYEGIINGLLL